MFSFVLGGGGGGKSVLANSSGSKSTPNIRYQRGGMEIKMDLSEW